MPNSGGAIDIRGLSKSGIVTRVLSTTQFESSQLAGMGDAFFQGWTIYIVRKGTGTGASPQGDYPFCSTYSSLTGLFTHTAFTTSISVGDEVYMVHPFIGSNTVTTVYPSNNIKIVSDSEVQTSAIAYTKVKELTFTGIQGGARISFDLRIDNVLGTAYAIIYKNGVPVPTIVAPFYTVYTDITGAYVTCTQDVYGLVANDLVQVYACVNVAARTAYVRNFRIGYDIITFPSVALAIDYVYIDPINGSPGTVWPIGMPGKAVNNLTDAIIIAGWRNTNKFHIKNSFHLDQNISGYNFFGDGDWWLSAVWLDGFDADECTFRDLSVLGSSPGYLTGHHCFVSGSFTTGDASYAQITGQFWDCLIGSVKAVPLSTQLWFIKSVAAGGIYLQTTQGGGNLAFIDCGGAFAFHSSDNAASVLQFICPDATISLFNDNTLGTAYINAAYRCMDSTDANINFVVNDYANFQTHKLSKYRCIVIAQANSGNNVLGTVFMQDVKVESIVVRARMPASADLTHISILSGLALNLTLLDPLLAPQANLDALDKQVSVVGPWNIPVGDTIVLVFTGTGAGWVSLQVEIEYSPSYYTGHIGLLK